MPEARAISVRRGCALITALLCSFLGYDVCLAQPSSQTENAPPKGVLEINGSLIQKLGLANSSDRSLTFEQPADKILLPPGRYRVAEVVVADGYSFKQEAVRDDSKWFTVTADKATKIAVGAPLSSTVTAERSGSVLTLEYQLLDANGREYSPGVQSDPPAFKAFKGDRQIGSGSFEYG